MGMPVVQRRLLVRLAEGDGHCEAGDQCDWIHRPGYGQAPRKLGSRLGGAMLRGLVRGTAHANTKDRTRLVGIGEKNKAARIEGRENQNWACMGAPKAA